MAPIASSGPRTIAARQIAAASMAKTVTTWPVLAPRLLRSATSPVWRSTTMLATMTR